MKKHTPSQDEAYALIVSTTVLFHSVTDNFLKHTEEGCIKIRQESPKFAVTVKLERKERDE